MNKFVKKLLIKVSFLSRKIVLNIVNIINYLIHSLGFKIQYRREIEYNKNQSTTLASFYNQIAQNSNNLADGTSCIIFSMDRAIQLHALLCSLFEKLDTPIPTYIIYRSTTEEHEKAYGDVIKHFNNKFVNFVRQVEKATFNPQLIQIIEKISTDKLFFLVDDILVTENINTSEFRNIDCSKYVLSLRMGTNLDHSYAIKKSQPLPRFISENMKDGEKVCWIWSEGLYDWAYPLSVDGHLFSTKEVLAMSKSIHFGSPNTFEGNLQIFMPIFKSRFGLAYSKSRLFNIPCNKVQGEVANSHGEVHQDDLLKKWNDGYQIDYKELYGYVNTSVHQDIAFKLIKRVNAK